MKWWVSLVRSRPHMNEPGPGNEAIVVGSIVAKCMGREASTLQWNLV